MNFTMSHILTPTLDQLLYNVDAQRWYNSSPAVMRHALYDLYAL